MLNRKIVAADEGNLTALKRLSSVCTHTANLYNALNRLPETLALFSEKADINLLIARAHETVRSTEILFYTPPITFPERMRMLIDEQSYSHVIGELTDTDESAYHLYYMMARVVEELARKYGSEELKNEAIGLMSSADAIANAFAQELESDEITEHARRIKSTLRRMKNQ
ncbi:MAG: hypothetical protein IJC25_01500 [Clostridia bacterium]|nr:hypothetical protein [Clostridia bacterium]